MVQEMGEPSTPPSIYNCPMNVLVEGVPSAAGDPTTIEYYLSSLTHVKCEVTQHGRSFLAKFQQKIGKFDHFESGQTLFCCTGSTS